MHLIERSILRRIVVKLVTAGVAYLAGHINGHLGITINPTELQAAVFIGLDIARHEIVKKWPNLSPYLS